MYFFAPRRFLLTLGLDKVLLLASFLFLISLFFVPCIHSCIHLHPSRFRMRRRDVLVTIGRRSSDASRRPSKSPLSCEPRTILLLLTIFTICSTIPRLPSRIYPALTYLYYHYRSSLVVLLSPFPFTALLRACTWLSRSETFSWHFISTFSERQ